MICHELVFEVNDCVSVLPVFSLPSNGSTAWADPYYGFTNPFFYTSATVVAWPLHTADPLIGSGDEPIESPEWEGFNESLPNLVRLEHCVLRATLSASLWALHLLISCGTLRSQGCFSRHVMRWTVLVGKRCMEVVKLAPPSSRTLT